jgi:hypothetical protein
MLANTESATWLLVDEAECVIGPECRVSSVPLSRLAANPDRFGFSTPSLLVEGWLGPTECVLRLLVRP